MVVPGMRIPFKLVDRKVRTGVIRLGVRWYCDDHAIPIRHGTLQM